MKIAGDALIAKDGAVIAKTAYREWLRRHLSGPRPKENRASARSN
jgi:hypothetical protein